jgi:hypothetical protein
MPPRKFNKVNALKDQILYDKYSQNLRLNRLFQLKLKLNLIGAKLQGNKKFFITEAVAIDSKPTK